VSGSRLGGAVVALIGAVALIGWLTNSRRLSAIGTDFIPVAPNTAVLFILLGGCLVVSAKWRWALAYKRSAITGSFIVAAGRLGEYLLGFDLGVDSWLFSIPHQNLG
jgi:two-component system, NtrC family, sensor kinase